MSLSAEQLKEVQAKWSKMISPILSDVLLEPNNDLTIIHICSTFWVAMCGSRFVTVLEELADGYDIFIQDEWSVELPKLLVEENGYCVAAEVVRLFRTALRLS